MTVDVVLLDNDDKDPFDAIKTTVDTATIDPINQYFLVPEDDDGSTTSFIVISGSCNKDMVASSTFSGTDAANDPYAMVASVEEAMVTN